ncbi:MAG: AAA family ATPase [Zavarzinella sp.]
MKLISAVVENFRSIHHSSPVSIDPKVTVLVGQNESGKTAFLQALHHSRPVEQNGGFDVDRDYPRAAVNEYRDRHEANPATVVTLTHELTATELDAITSHLGVRLFHSLQVTTTHHYKNHFTIGIKFDEGPYIRHLLDDVSLPREIKAEALAMTSIRGLFDLLRARDLNVEGKEFVESLTRRFQPDAHKNWQNLLAHELWEQFLQNWLPKFFYFDEYYLLPGKVNLKTLALRAQQENLLSETDKTVLSLLQLAGVQLQELIAPQGYEQIKARLEGLQNSITDRIFEYWTQNRELEVEFDIREDPKEAPPYQDGPNLYLRIKSRRHRVTVPFNQRSRGFIWFFSFIVWFDTIKRQVGNSHDLVLLLDEPGLNLHVLAQADFLRYIDALAEKKHQIVYTTHSPFMVPNNRLQQIRLVEDRPEQGTVITTDFSNVASSTLYPIRAALANSVAENLFQNEPTLLVDSPTDLVFLRIFSSILEKAGRTGLRDDLTIVPVGGLDRVAAVLALLGTHPPEVVVLQATHDHQVPPHEPLVEKFMKTNHVLQYGQFRTVDTDGEGTENAPPASGIEDLFSVGFYLKLFNATFTNKLPKVVKENDLPAGDRIVERLNRYLIANSVMLRSQEGYNPYSLANYLAANPPKTFDKDTLARFEELFEAINSMFS